MRRRFGVLLVCLAGAGLAPSAAAAPVFGVYGTIAEGVSLAPTTNLAMQQQAQTGPPGTEQLTSLALILPQIKLQVGPALLGLPPNQFLVTLHGSASVFGLMAPDGNDHLMMHGVTTVTAPLVSFVNGSVTTAGSAADASLSESWSETMQVAGPANTSVQLLLTHYFDGAIFNEGFNSNLPVLPNTGALGSVSLNNLGSPVSCVGHCGGGNFNQSYNETDVGPFNYADTFVLTVQSNTNYMLEEGLNLQAFAGDQVGSDFTSADAAETNWITIDVLTPGASVSFASGLNYASSPAPMPEPGTLALLGVAAFGLAWHRRKL